MIPVLDGRQRVHFVGIAGAGMSGLARYLLVRGYTVSGSDHAPGQIGESLQALGATVHEGHAARSVCGADLIVISSAVPEDNPEVVAARDHGIPVTKRAELLGAIMNPSFGIAVAGTHGKSTTSALIAHLLAFSELDPTVLIGAVSHTLGSNARVGRSDLVVVEADEYDASFHSLRPRIGVILNMEAEHLDFYGDEAAVFAAFQTFADSVSDLLVLCADDVNTSRVSGRGGTEVVTYGIATGDWRATDICQCPDGIRFDAVCGTERIPLHLRLAGLHNVLNTLAAVTVAKRLHLANEIIAKGVATFEGVQRRLEVRGEINGTIIVDDYAHHATEMIASIAALRERYPDRRVLLVFQPHTYSRTRSFFEDLAGALCGADRTYLLDIYAARERDTLAMHSRDLAAAGEQLGASARYTGDMDTTIDAVRQEMRAGDLVVTMGAGDVYRVADALLAAEAATS